MFFESPGQMSHGYMSLGVEPRAYYSKLSLYAKYQTLVPSLLWKIRWGFLLLLLLLFGKVKSTPRPRPKTGV